MNTKKKQLLWTSVSLAALILVIIAVVVLAMPGSGKEQPDPSLDAGLSYLQMREAKSPDDVRQARKDMERKKLEQQRDALIAELTNGDKDPFTMFKDAVIMGDSRAVGFWYYDFLDKASVIADGGHTIREMQKNLDLAVQANPATVYLCYGLNDVSIGLWDTKEEYVAEYIATVKELQSRLPDATIVVSSILPTTDVAFEKSSSWRNIPQWSAALEEGCKENGILFANCDSIFTEYPGLWDPVDGIHFRRELYPHWAISLVVTTLMKEAEG